MISASARRNAELANLLLEKPKSDKSFSSQNSRIFSSIDFLSFPNLTFAVITVLDNFSLCFLGIVAGLSKINGLQ